jgi:hypothetical protein
MPSMEETQPERPPGEARLWLEQWPPAIPPTEADSTPTPITCYQCGTIDAPAIEHGHWGPHHMRATCRHCRAFVQWVSSRTQADRQARAEHFRRVEVAKRPVTPNQRRKLEALGWEGSLPANRQEAIDLIDGLSREGSAV